MNKRFFISNTKESVNIGLIKDKFKNKRVLVVDGSVDGLKEIEQARAYFHIVIANGNDAVKSVQGPDIIMYDETSPYINGQMAFDNRVSGKDRLFCVNYKALKLLAKTNKGHKSYVLSCSFCDAPLNNKPGKDCHIDFGLNATFPGQHLALIGEAESIYTIGSNSPTGTVFADLNSLTEFINQKKRYAVPTNLVGLNRDPYIKKFI